MGLFRNNTKQQPEAKAEMVDESLRKAPPEWQPTIHEKLIMLMLSLISFMVSLVSSIVMRHVMVMSTDFLCRMPASLLLPLV